MSVSSPLVQSGTPGPPCASPHHSCARTRTSRLKAALGSRSTIPGVLTFTRLPPYSQPGRRLLGTKAVPLSLALQMETYWVCDFAPRNSIRAGWAPKHFRLTLINTP
jgi:hypothetical protein